VIRGLGGDDVLEGILGDDEIHGGAGRDRMRGGDGADRLFAQDGEADFVVDPTGAGCIAERDRVDPSGSTCR